MHKEAVRQWHPFGINFPKGDSILSNQERIFKYPRLEFGDPRIVSGLIQCRSVLETQGVRVMRTSTKQKKNEPEEANRTELSGTINPLITSSQLHRCTE